MLHSSLQFVNVSKNRYYAWSKELDLPAKILLSLGFALLTGLFAQLRVNLPWTPVPITGQTLAVFFSALLLGGFWGGLSQGFYLLGGAAGIPWFTGFSGGIAAIMGPTGGYLIGFVFAATFLGYALRTFPLFKKVFPLFFLLLFTNLFLIYLPGLLQLYFWTGPAAAETGKLSSIIIAGILPFVPGDLIKIAIATLVLSALSPDPKNNR